MISLYDGQVTDLLNNRLRYNPDVIAISYAIQQEKQRLLMLADATRTNAMVDQLPEEVLDILAVEMRAPYYTQDMDITQKRAIIKNTSAWYYKAGTKAAVEELIATVFGQGEIVEWFEFDEPPYTPGTFDIITDVRMTEDIVSQFLQIIGRAKNASAQIRRVLVERHGSMDIFTSAGVFSMPGEPVTNCVAPRSRSMHGNAVAKTGAASTPEGYITNTVKIRASLSGQLFTGAIAATVGADGRLVTNSTGKRAASASGAVFTGAAAFAIWNEAGITNNVPGRSMAAECGLFCAGMAVTTGQENNIVNHASAKRTGATGTGRVGAVLIVHDISVNILNNAVHRTASIRQTNGVFSFAIATIS